MADNTAQKTAIHEVFAYLRIRNAAAAIDFYQQAFGATEIFRLTEPGGRIGHAELKFGPAVIMVADEYPEFGIQGPEAIGGTSVAVHLHVENADVMTEQAKAAGATVLMEPTDQFYGERSARLRDPYGHEWLIGHEIEKVSPEEMQRRFNEMCEEA